MGGSCRIEPTAFKDSHVTYFTHKDADTQSPGVLEQCPIPRFLLGPQVFDVRQGTTLGNASYHFATTLAKTRGDTFVCKDLVARWAVGAYISPSNR